MYRPLILLPRVTPAIVTARNIQPEEQSSTTILVGAGVGEGSGMTLGGGGVNEAVGWELLVLVPVFVIAGSAGSVPVMEAVRNRTRAWAEVELSPKKRKFGVSYGSGKPSKGL